MSAAVSKPHHSHLRGTTPFPNFLIDEAMPGLKDTEWRLLCVIIRQTLGWRQKNPVHQKNLPHHKTCDWLSQVQLVQKTGRDRAALSRAINALVQTGYIEVTDEFGVRLSTPAKRRQCRGRVFYALHPRWLKYTSADDHHTGGVRTDNHRSYNESLRSQTPKSEYPSSTKSPSNRSNSLWDTPVAKSEHQGAAKANTTKETLTKENDTKENDTKENDTNEISFKLGLAAAPKQKRLPCSDAASSGLNQRSGERVDASHGFTNQAFTSQAMANQTMNTFLDLFRKLSTELLGYEADTDLTQTELHQLTVFLEKAPQARWRSLLQAYFKSELEYVQRRAYAASALANTGNILLVQRQTYRSIEKAPPSQATVKS